MTPLSLASRFSYRLNSPTVNKCTPNFSLSLVRAGRLLRARALVAIKGRPNGEPSGKPLEMASRQEAGSNDDAKQPSSQAAKQPSSQAAKRLSSKIFSPRLRCCRPRRRLRVSSCLVSSADATELAGPQVCRRRLCAPLEMAYFNLVLSVRY